MAFRSLSDIFILMRNNAITRKNVFQDQNFSDDRVALVLNLESSNAKTYLKAPPEWMNDVDEIQYEIRHIKNKSKELTLLHDKHLNRPTLDDNTDEEKAIDALTQELTKLLSTCQIKVKKIANRGRRSGAEEQRLIKNIVYSLANSLSELTVNFRKAQSVYLKKIKSREERSKLPFSDSNYTNSIMPEDSNDYEDALFERNYGENVLEQIQKENENKLLVDEREKEITNIVKSIQDLNDVFKDLATMVVDQGTVLDRIDYNIENMSMSVKSGLQELKKASKYQKSDRKMYCISILAIIVFFLFILLFITKF